MADVKKRVVENVPGEFFVDSTCIDCDTCRQLAPVTFEDAGEHSFVYAQPQTEHQHRDALRALVSCPTGSIGTLHAHNAKAVMADFPLHLEDGVYYTGFNSPKSYGGHSYFIQHPAGNWLIDSPKYLPHLVRKFTALGGLRYIFLTHRDDVAEAHQYAAHFGSQRLIHRAELSAQPDAEILLEGHEPSSLGAEFLIIPTPGHTRGHCVLLYKQRFLFSGDHLWWSRVQQGLSASREYCWYSWSQQAQSMARLQHYAFEWVLPGHGQRIKRAPEVMQEALTALVQRMQTTTS
jgi:glyoxylase-like metal-dependent hydrolase (beta-lactamase superfamily II)/ferredoxin